MIGTRFQSLLQEALDQNSSFIEALLEQLDELFITEQL